jgi:hypothetical protein
MQQLPLGNACRAHFGLRSVQRFVHSSRPRNRVTSHCTRPSVCPWNEDDMSPFQLTKEPANCSRCTYICHTRPQTSRLYWD